MAKVAAVFAVIVCSIVVLHGASANPFGYPAHSTDCPGKCAHKVQPVTLVETSPAFRPASHLEFLEIFLDCFNTLRIPLRKYPAYLSGLFPEDAETKCFLRCVAIKLGVYCDEAGADIERHCLQFGLGQCCEQFKSQHELCLQQNSVPCPDRCTAAYKQELCFQEPIAKYLDYHFHQFVGSLHHAKGSNSLSLLHP
ncbi:uncharacterized protein LOC125959152 [Anopheles darlingi]|uniref:uncharacterized protein LOC125959152 n=1 Tax=Anopheles darlingi TaxID=43151 RepID=UPI0021006244|nr:uncharacterized protein LOC125959152 [Anopheles darlingi]